MASNKLSEDQILALRTLLEFARARFALKKKDIIKRLSLGEKDISNFYAGTAAPQIHDKIFYFVEEFFIQKESELPSWIYSNLKFLYPYTFSQNKNIEYSDLTLGGIISNRLGLPEKEIQEFCIKYAGKYQFVRYAAQPKSYDTAKDRAYGILRGHFEIDDYNINNQYRLPTYSSFFRRRDQDFNTPPVKETGFIVPIGDYFVCIGFEEHNQYPNFLYAKNQPFKIHEYFSAITVRRHVSGEVFSSRILFIRQEQENEALEKISGVSYFDPKQLEIHYPDILHINSLLTNDVAQEGRSVLFLKSPHDSDFE
ncbi:hypothetical protein FF098_015865 [Parvularcula flava]|uniref:Uncharacterized protein n=1 Tax=Aquisalinus luteolus TaxID=1566827 RepID=A0A8J3A3S3_9PROT|nr:hypothetical protein [Aquisalinus luteolus]NHK29392.1 hypothetical protein [Aquisalinus luteolus]GGI00912.1 hypothetical protein GCM10011355_30310 [Aquisalinus luteolus]